MKIVVCVKQVNGEINPFDACALESALRIEHANITILSMGRPDVAGMLKSLTRLGAIRAILLTDPAFAGSDTLATAYVLSLAIRKINPDLVICGRQSIDGDTAQVGPCLSRMLGFSLITNVMEIHRIDDRNRKICCTGRMGEECGNLPALITLERINTLRFPSIRAKTGEVEIRTAEDIGADKNKCGLKGSPTRVLKTYESSLGKRKCTWISPDDLLCVIKEAKSKSRYDIKWADSDTKLDEIWAVGEELRKVGLAIAKRVRVIDRQPAVRIAELAQKQQPRVILWTADFWGRRNAPIVSAMLQTGLCADCTSLETDGEKLYLYRPAYGGSLMAKIECRTLPQMATVRTVSGSEDEVIVAGGKGVGDYFDLLRKFAKKTGAGLGASRSLVDMGIAPYELQIGLTGKSIHSKVYIACGISGSVQHPCSIEQAGTVIAINKDQNARIFDYADYGIVADAKECIRLSTP